MSFDLDDPTLLFQQDFLDDPAPLYAHLRAHAPVWELPGTGTYLVSTAALVAEATARPEDFSNNLLGLLYTGDDGLPTVFDMTHLGSAIHVLSTSDPPVHTQHRKLLQPLLNPASIAALSPFVAEAVERLTASFVAAGGGNYAPAVSEPLPVEVIAELVGIPASDVPMLLPLVLESNDLLAGVVDAAAMASASEASMQVVSYLDGLVRGWPFDDPGPTVCAALARAAAAGEITIEDGLGMLVQLLGAGTDTTTSLIGRAALQLARDQELQAQVRANLDLVPALLEETLRHDGPFRFHYRAVLHDTELGGVHLPAGSRLLLMWGAANLDEDYFERPDEFDITRAALRSHYAFGRGIHFCIGAPLARVEARLAVEQLLRSTRSFTLDPASAPTFRRSIFVRRLGNVPLLVEPA
jgi:cytochrome P450